MGKGADERSAFWLPAALPGYELFKARFRTHRYARHLHEAFGLCVVERGAHRFRIEGVDNVAPPRSVFVINPGDVHDGGAFAEREGYTFRVFFVDNATMAAAVADEPGDAAGEPRFLHPVLDAPHLADTLIAIHRASEPGQAADPLELQSRLTLGLREVAQRGARLRPPQTPAVDRARILRARDWMLDHLDQTVDLAGAAAEAGLSPFHFLRRFKAVTGLPPHAWLTQARVARARDLLRHGLPPAEVATMAGFFDQPHFTRHFLAITGLTPGQYRAAFVPRNQSKNVQDETGCTA